MADEADRLTIEDVLVRPLEKAHLRGVFSDVTDNEFSHLIEWFRTAAWPAYMEKNSKTFVVQYAGKVVAYMTILFASVTLPPEKYPNHDSCQVLKLGKLYVVPSLRSRGIGEILLKIAVGIAKEADSLIACKGIVVDANLNERTINFYSRNGFEQFDRETTLVKMWLKISGGPVVAA